MDEIKIILIVVLFLFLSACTIKFMHNILRYYATDRNRRERMDETVKNLISKGYTVEIKTGLFGNTIRIEQSNESSGACWKWGRR